MTMYNDLWKQLFKANIEEAKAIYKLAEDYNLFNTQDFINWQDELNALSILPQ